MKRLGKHYRIEYRMHSAGVQKHLYVEASNKYDACDKAEYEIIPEMEEDYPYSVWVANVTYSNGKIHVFNSSEGNGYGD